jgi:alpha-D-glucose phosphate-specific phosphoglucomutase
MAIKFGTDGWRAIISDEFTFPNVRIVAQAISNYIINHKLDNRPLIVGYDPRFLADKFAEETVKVAESNGISCLLVDRDTPTPVIAFEVKDRKAAGAVMITASHNPPQYCGMKFIPEYAGPASKEITAEIEQYVAKPGWRIREKSAAKGTVERFNPKERYLKSLEGMIDLSIIKNSNLKVGYDAMYGCGRGYVDLMLERCGIKVSALHCKRDVLFGGITPEPVEECLEELIETVKKEKLSVGLANDGDADRFGVVGEDGRFYSANEVLSMLALYLIEDKGYKGSIVRSVATTGMLDKIAALHKMKLHETPVGFKYIAEKMMHEHVVIGGEESGGLSILGHIPEKDGILADLLIVEMIAKKKKPLSAIFTDMQKKIGAHYSKRINMEIPDEKKVSLIAGLKMKTPEKFAGKKVMELKTIDGAKLILEDGSWVLLRPSGTEPLLRVYMESTDNGMISAMEKDTAALIGA